MPLIKRLRCCLTYVEKFKKTFPRLAKIEVITVFFSGVNLRNSSHFLIRWQFCEIFMLFQPTFSTNALLNNCPYSRFRNGEKFLYEQNLSHTESPLIPKMTRYVQLRSLTCLFTYHFISPKIIRQRKKNKRQQHHNKKQSKFDCQMTYVMTRSTIKPFLLDHIREIKKKLKILPVSLLFLTHLQNDKVQKRRCLYRTTYSRNF